MALDYYACQLGQQFGWTAPAYLEKEGSIPHIGACCHSLVYDRRHDYSFEVRVEMCNIGGASGIGG